jgi:hypothetical protein
MLGLVERRAVVLHTALERQEFRTAIGHLRPDLIEVADPLADELPRQLPTAHAHR